MVSEKGAANRDFCGRSSENQDIPWLLHKTLVNYERKMGTLWWRVWRDEGRPTQATDSEVADNGPRLSTALLCPLLPRPRGLCERIPDKPRAEPACSTKASDLLVQIVKGRERQEEEIMEA